MDKVLQIIMLTLGAIVLIFLFSLVMAWPVMLLWDWIMPILFGLKSITFWQSWGLLMLSGLLIKNSSSGSNK